MAKNVRLQNPTLAHVKKYEEELKNNGLDTGKTSPFLLPKYARNVRKDLQI